MINDFNTLTVKAFIEKHGIIDMATYEKLVQATEVAMKEYQERVDKKRSKVVGVIKSNKY